MNQEFETKVLDVNPEEIIQKLRSLGAEESDEVLMRRWVFDSKKGDKEWIRLRDNGKKVTLAFKQKSDGSVGGTKEIEVEVSDFDKTAEIFHSIPFEKFTIKKTSDMSLF